MEGRRFTAMIITIATLLSSMVVLATDYHLQCSYTSRTTSTISGSPYFGGGGSGCNGGWSDNYVYVDSDHPSDEGWEQWEIGSTTTTQDADGYTWRGRIYFDVYKYLEKPSGTDAYIGAMTRLTYSGGSADSGWSYWRTNGTLLNAQQTATKSGLTGQHTFRVVWFLKGYAKASSTDDALVDSSPSGVNDFYVIQT